MHLTYDPAVSVLYRTGSGCMASPVVGENGTVYYGAFDRYLYGVYEGALAWPRVSTGDMIAATAAVGLDGSVYYGTSGGALYALRPDGTAKWPAPFRVGVQAISGALMIAADGSICFSTDSGYVYSVDSNTGAMKWSYSTGGRLTYGLSSSLDGSVLYAPCSDGYVYAINSGGTLKWRSKAPVYASNTCAVGDDGTVYVGGTDCNLYALNPADGSQKWARRVYGKVTTPATVGSDGSIFFGSADLNLYALKPDGSIRWSYWLKETLYSAPIIDPQGTLVFGTTSGKVMAFDSSNGSVSWQRALGTGVYSSPAAGRDGSIYVLDGSGNLHRLSGPVAPEPSSLAALGGGLVLAALGARRRGRRGSANM